MLLHSATTCKTSPAQNQYLSNSAKHSNNKNSTTTLYKSRNSHSAWSIIPITTKENRLKCSAFSGIGILAAAVVLSTPAPAEETLSNVPQMLSGKNCDSESSLAECEEMKVKRIQKPKSRDAESCTSKCTTTCTRGGEGSPGEGPLNVRGPIVVFKQGFRSRHYCLVECSDICNLIDDAGKRR